MVGDDRVQAAFPTLPAGLQRTEQRLLESCKDVTPAHKLVSDESLKMTVLTECEGHLVKAGLLPDANVKAARMTLLLAGVSLLSAVAIIKILVALSRGRTNVLFLVVACVIFAFLVYRVANPFRTWAGEAILADQRILFSALKARAVSMAVPTGSNDLALLASVAGSAQPLRQRDELRFQGGRCPEGNSTRAYPMHPPRGRHKRPRLDRRRTLARRSPARRAGSRLRTARDCW
jgi:uncharacterized protein (TIGR04222 family)